MPSETATPTAARDELQVQPPPLPSRRWPYWISLLRDVALVYELSRIVRNGVVTISMLLHAGQPLPKTMGPLVVTLGVACQTIGFFLAGIFERHRRWRHLMTVAAIVWAIGTAGIVTQKATPRSWAGSLPLLLLAMGVGGGASHLVRPRR